MNYQCEIFNIGNHRSEQLMDVVSLIEDNLGKKAKIEFMPMQPGDVPESFADIDKSIEMLGYKPITNVGVGIKKLAFRMYLAKPPSVPPNSFMWSNTVMPSTKGLVNRSNMLCGSLFLKGLQRSSFCSGL